MKLHEHQAKALLASMSIPIPRGRVVDSADDAVAAARELGGAVWAVKAQIHAGGRGKAGGVKLAHELDEVRVVASALLGKRLVTYQNAPDGQPVDRVLVEETLPIARELYLSVLVDRESERVAVVASAAGGMDIEEVARESPGTVLTERCDPLLGLQAYQCRALAFRLGLVDKQVGAFVKLARSLYRLFVDKDLSLVEINPLVLTASGDLVALDCKIAVDDNALWRRKDLAVFRDVAQQDAKETAAQEADLNYIALTGSIGCMVNGAGLAMATMDLIQLSGGEPANFLDVGGGTTPERVATAFKIILSDAKVKAILVNIFGGIVRCDVIADGIIAAVREVGVRVPVVVRLEGTNVDLGRQKLAESGLSIVSAPSLADAARLAVEAAA